MKIIDAKLNGTLAEVVLEAQPDGMRYPIRFEAPSYLTSEGEADPIVLQPELTIKELTTQFELSDADARAIVVSYLL